jgi:hypothetical protein
MQGIFQLIAHQAMLLRFRCGVDFLDKLRQAALQPGDECLGHVAQWAQRPDYLFEMHISPSLERSGGDTGFSRPALCSNFAEQGKLTFCGVIPAEAFRVTTRRLR